VDECKPVVCGTRVQSPRLIEVLTFGCVPVIIADGYDLPLAWLFDWNKFSIRLPEADYEKLPEVLAAADWGALHANLRRVIGFFVYHRTPIMGDALWAWPAPPPHCNFTQAVCPRNLHLDPLKRRSSYAGNGTSVL